MENEAPNLRHGEDLIAELAGSECDVTITGHSLLITHYSLLITHHSLLITFTLI
jgi:hypothetical protein